MRVFHLLLHARLLQCLYGHKVRGHIEQNFWVCLNLHPKRSLV